MELKEKYSFRNPAPKFIIQTAVELQCYDDRDGALETCKASQDRTAEFLGRLTDILVEKKILTKEDISKLLPSYEVIE